MTPGAPLDRRAFLAGAALVSAGAVMLGDRALAQTPSLAKWRDKIGLQLFTVRDRFPTDYPGTLKAVAAIGYREVQSTQSYAGYSLPDVKRLMDENHLVSAVTHVTPPSGAQFEPTLDAYYKAGFRYTSVAAGPERGMAVPPAPTGPTGVSAPPPPPITLETAKRLAAGYNMAGRITKKHGLKLVLHNNIDEFAPLADHPGQTQYDILIAETDPDLVALELDIGWAMAAGADALELFRRAPGRFEVWHVKDMAGLSKDASLSPGQRGRLAKVVGMGDGEIDYRPIFAQADHAGLKHYYLEQDSAPQTGDSMAAAAASYRYLTKILV